MAAIKAYTDLSQSKTLSKILQLESADMFHFIHEIDTVGFGYKKDAAEFYSKTEFEYLPCWSLAALLGVLPDYTLQDNPNGTVFVVSEKEKPIMSDDYDNPVDACVAMIEKLHELNLL